MDDYDQAIRCGNSAILLEETAPDIFSMKLGQLKAGAGATIRLTYIMELPMEDYTIRMTIPTTIAPRYFTMYILIYYIIAIHTYLLVYSVNPYSIIFFFWFFSYLGIYLLETIPKLLRILQK